MYFTLRGVIKMDYATPDRDTLISSLQSSLAAALETINDPTNVEKRDFLYMREPDTAADSFEGFPIIYLEDYSMTTEQASVNNGLHRIEARAEIVIEGRDEDYESKIYQDELADQVFSTFMSDERQTLGENKIAGAEIIDDARSTGINTDGKPILRRTMVISFDLLLEL